MAIKYREKLIYKLKEYQNYIYNINSIHGIVTHSTTAT